MKNAYGYGQGESPDLTDDEQMKIAAIATTEGAISGPKINMTELLENFVRMKMRDASEMTMLHDTAPLLDAAEDVFPQSTMAPELKAHALAMANLAVQIVQNGGELSEIEYIGSGTPVHEEAVSLLPLVQMQRAAL